jgi:hypothetical protein
MRARLLVALLLSVSGCAQGTFVSVSINQQVSSPATVRIAFALTLDGRSANGSLSGSGGKAITFPTTASLQIGSGSGSMKVTATAYDAAGAIIDSATGTVDVVAGSTVPLTLILGGTTERDMGSGSSDMAGDAGIVPGAPSAPTNVIASSGNAQATVTWSAPSSVGTSAIGSYTVTSVPGGIRVTTPDGNTTMATVAGLTNGTTYTFAVAATNAAGTGQAALSNAVTPTATPMVPSAPTNVMAVANVDHGATISWTASDNHGSPLQGYAVSSTQLTGTLATAGPTATSVQLMGLTPGSLYTFTVTATNGIGPSVASFPSNTITAATFPGAPTAVMADANIPNGATVSWTAPASDGFSAVTSYTVTASPGGMMATSATTSAPVSGLTGGTQYTFAVVATNAVGNSSPSSPSGSVTAIAPLAAPSGLIACGNNGKINVSFNAVSGAQSYDIYYSTTMPATGGTKVNVTSDPTPSSPTTITVANGSYYVSVFAVNAVGEGAAVNGTTIASSTMHDTLVAVYSGSPPAIDFYDCYSQLPNNSNPTRNLSMNFVDATTSYYVGPAAIAVDASNSAVWVVDGTNRKIDGWNSANSISGSVSKADYVLSGLSGGLSGFALDTTNKKAYLSQFAGVDGTVERFSYTTPSDLNGSKTAEAGLISIDNVSGGNCPPEGLFVNPATGDLWVAYDRETSGTGTCPGNVGLFATAYSAATGATPGKYFRFTSSNENDSRVAYAPANGGTLFAVSNNALDFLQGADAATSGVVTANGSLSPVGGSAALASGNSLLLEADGSSIYQWSTSSPSGSPAKTVANASSANSYAAVAYVP